MAGNSSYKRRRQWHSTPLLLTGKCHGQRSLVGCSPWGRQESDTTEWLHFRFSLSCIGEGNGNPLQCSCLEKPRDGGDWWAAVYGVAQSWTRLKWLSSLAAAIKYFVFHLYLYWRPISKWIVQIKKGAPICLNLEFLSKYFYYSWFIRIEIEI